MIVSHGKFVIRPDQLERAKDIFRDMVERSREEPGCITYDFFESITNPNVMMLFQEWESMDTINAHFATEHMESFLSQLPELLEGEVVTHRYALQDEASMQDVYDEADGSGEIEFEFEEEPVTLH